MNKFNNYMEVFVFLKLIALLSFTSFLSVNVLAADAAEVTATQNRLAAQNAALLQLRSSNASITQALSKAQTDSRAAAAAYARANDEFKKATSNFEDVAGSGVFGFGAGSGTPELKAAKDKAEVALNSARESYQKAANLVATTNRELIASGGKIISANAQVADAKGDLKSLKTTLDYEMDALIMNRLGLMGDFSQLAAKAGDNEMAFSKLNQKLDKALIGKYLQEKMKNMLNDKETFCTAKNQCDGKGGAVTDKSMNKLFSGSAATASSGNSSGTSVNGSAGGAGARQ